MTLDAHATPACGLLLEEAARRLGLSRKQIQYLIQAGRIRVQSRLGPLILLDRGDIERESKRQAALRAQMSKLERM